MYHEVFWVAVAAAAPIIALAAIIAFSDQMARLGDLYPDARKLYDDGHRDLSRAYTRSNITATLLSLGNTVAQTVVLGIALSSLGGSVNEIPAWSAIALEVAGLAAVATVALVGVVIRAAIWAGKLRAKDAVLNKETGSESRS
jgi:hypothetical protein